MAVFVTPRGLTRILVKTEGFESFKQLTFNKIAGELLFKSKN